MHTRNHLPCWSTILLIYLVLEHSCVVSCFEPLGSKKPSQCLISKYECPSHYICTSDNTDSTASSTRGTCECDRFFGFYGPDCRKLSLASYLLLVYCLIIVVIVLFAFTYTLSLLWTIYSERNQLKSHNGIVVSTLTLNAFAILAPGTIFTGYACVVWEVDRNSFSVEFLELYVWAYGFSFLMLSSMGLSVYWIELVESLKGFKKKRHYYKVGIYAISIIWSFLTIIADTVYYSSSSVFTILGVMMIGYSYHYGGKAIVKSLNKSNRSNERSIQRNMQVIELSSAVEKTRKTISRVAFVVCVTCIGMVVTSPSSSPLYSNQNNLPRWAQGQFFTFVAMFCVLFINIQITKYIHFSVLRNISKYVPLKEDCLLKVVWNLRVKKPKDLDNVSVVGIFDDSIMNKLDMVSSDTVVSTAMTKDSSDLQKPAEITNSSQMDVSGVFLVSPKQLVSDNNTSQDDNILMSHFASMMNNARPSDINPIVLVTLNMESHRTVSRIVVNYGNIKLVNVDNDGGEELLENCVLSKGSHAFVRCYGESFLRCALASSNFGSAGGHPSLASFSQVMLAGEIEVNDEGILTRWLNKSGLLNMPPRFMIYQAGLPFELAWLYATEEEIGEIDQEKRSSLVKSGSLCKLENPSLLPRNLSVESEFLKSRQSSSSRLNAPHSQSPQHKKSHSGELNRVIWVIKASEETLWRQPSIFTSAYFVAKDIVFRFNVCQRNIRNSMRIGPDVNIKALQQEALLQLQQENIQQASSSTTIGDSSGSSSSSGGGGGGSVSGVPVDSDRRLLVVDNLNHRTVDEHQALEAGLHPFTTNTTSSSEEQKHQNENDNDSLHEEDGDDIDSTNALFDGAGGDGSSVESCPDDKDSVLVFTKTLPRQLVLTAPSSLTTTFQEIAIEDFEMMTILSKEVNESGAAGAGGSISSQKNEQVQVFQCPNKHAGGGAAEES